METTVFEEFLKSDDTLQVYTDDALIFSSRRKGIAALLEYINELATNYQKVVIFDKVTGNAAALLAIKAKCREVHSPVGSQSAIKTLDKYGIRYNISNIVPYIQQKNNEEMCPMEKLSLNKTPEEFYEILRITANKTDGMILYK